jgi:two-component system alkaline phosphatase synthesis response regulator PhoP
MVQRILVVVDDDRETLRLVQAHLEQAGYQVLVAYDGEMALHMLRRERPDLVLVDLVPPSRDGQGVTRAGWGEADLAALPIIMLNAFEEDRDKSLGLEQGAGDDVTSPFSPGQVVTRVRAILSRAQGESAPPHVIQAGSVTLDPDRYQVEVEGQPVHLTRTEFSLLRALAEQPGRALTRAEMIEEGLGYSYEGLDRTVDSHIKNLRRKLDDAGGAAHLVETVFGVGYRLADRDRV